MAVLVKGADCDSRYIGEFVKISVAGRDGNWHEVGTSRVPKP